MEDNIDLIWSIESIIKTLLIVAALIIIALLVYWRKKNETNKRTQIILAALEHDPSCISADLLRSLNTPQKSVKERLLNKLMLGILFSVAGTGAIIAETAMYFANGEYFEDDGVLLIAGTALFATGIAFLVYYFVGRRLLQTEDREQRTEK